MIIQISVGVHAFNPFGDMPEGRIAGSHDNSMFEDPLHCFPQQLYQFTFLPATYMASSLSTSSPRDLACFSNSHADRSEVVSQCAFEFHFSSNWLYCVSFHMLHGYLISLKKCIFKYFVQFLSFCFAFIVLNCMSSFYIMDIHFSSDMWLAYLPSILYCVFVLWTMSSKGQKFFIKVQCILFVYFFFLIYFLKISFKTKY